MDQIAVVYMTTRLSQDRLAEMPPRAPLSITDPTRRAEIESNLKVAAQFWDVYRDIVQLSFLYKDKFTHLMLCDKLDDDSPDDLRVAMATVGAVSTFSDEADLVRAAFDYIAALGCVPSLTSARAPLLQFGLAGWHIGSDIWAPLVNKAIKYRIPVIQDMLCGLDVKWPASRRLLDIATIYTQGAGTFRKIPRLVDALQFWGVIDPSADVPPKNEIEDVVCDYPEIAAAEVEPYLRGMEEVLKLYLSGCVAQDDSQEETVFVNSEYSGPVWPI